MIRLISILTIRIIRLISIDFVKFRIFILIVIHFVKFRVFALTPIHFVNFRMFTQISIHFVKFRIFTLISIRFRNFRIIHQLQSTLLENWKFCAYAIYDYSILISLINSFFKKEDWKLFFRPITEHQFVESAKMLPSDRLGKYL